MPISLRCTSNPYRILAEAAERIHGPAKVLPFRSKVTPEKFKVQVADGSMSTNPMRRLVYRKCEDCGHEYTQAARTGNCPKCHGEHVVNTGEGACVAPYRK